MQAVSQVDSRLARRLVLLVTAMAACFCLLGSLSQRADAAINLIGDTTSDTGTSGASSVTVSTPPGTSGGDIELVQIQGESGSSIATPSGWSSVYSIFAPYGWSTVFWKEATS